MNTLDLKDVAPTSRRTFIEQTAATVVGEGLAANAATAGAALAAGGEAGRV